MNKEDKEITKKFEVGCYEVIKNYHQALLDVKEYIEKRKNWDRENSSIYEFVLDIVNKALGGVKDE